jgi:hypothetical protein
MTETILHKPWVIESLGVDDIRTGTRLVEGQLSASRKTDRGSGLWGSSLQAYKEGSLLDGRRHAEFPVGDRD